LFATEPTDNTRHPVYPNPSRDNQRHLHTSGSQMSNCRPPKRHDVRAARRQSRRMS